MGKFEDLKAKGYINLTAEERAEYQALKNGGLAQEAIVDKPKMVELSQEEYDRLMKADVKIQKLESPDGWEETVDTPEDKKGTVRMWDDKVAIDWAYNANDSREAKKAGVEYWQIYDITWLLPDGTKEMNKMSLSDFVKNVDRVEVKLSNKDVKKMQKTLGTVIRTKVDGAYNIRTFGEVPNIIRTEKATWEVTLPDGRKIRLPDTRLNA